MVNPGELFLGAAVGGPLGPAFDVFREVVEKTFEFNPTLKSVKSTVDALELLIQKIEGHNNALGGNRAGEVEELKQTMAEGGKLIKELLDVNEWSCLKAHYTNQLVVLDESLKRHLEILKVQGVIDVKEALVEAKDTNKDVKEGLALTKDIGTDMKEALVVSKLNTQFLKDISVTAEDHTNQLDRIKAILTAGLLDLQKEHYAMICNIMSNFTRPGMENKVGSFIEAAALGANLEELDDAVKNEMKMEESYWFGNYMTAIGERTRGIFELIDRKRAENKEMSYIPTEELKNFRVQMEEGVKLLRNCTKVLEWTEDLKSEYTNKFLHLDKTLERLHNRLNGIHPFKRNTGKCGRSCGTTSMKDSGIINDRFYHSDRA